jgi:hypothetical protein
MRDPDQNLELQSGFSACAQPRTAVWRAGCGGQIQLWNHILAYQELYGITWAASTGYR